MCLSAGVYREEGIFQPCSSSLSKPIRGVQMKMEDALPQARRVQHRGQVASSVCCRAKHIRDTYGQGCLFNSICIISSYHLYYNKKVTVHPGVIRPLCKLNSNTKWKPRFDIQCMKESTRTPAACEEYTWRNGTNVGILWTGLLWLWVFSGCKALLLPELALFFRFTIWPWLIKAPLSN